MSGFASIGETIIDDFLVNDDSTGDCYQSSPAIASDPCGNFVIVWKDDRNGNSDIYAQRYAASGSPVGSNFKVNDDTGITAQYSPGIAMDSSGNYVIVWVDNRNVSFDVIYAQRYDSTGAPLGSNVNVYDDPALHPSRANPAVAMNDSGNFVIACKCRLEFGGDHIYAQMYNPAGTPLGDKFRVNDDDGGADEPAIAASGAGNFVITWEDTRAGGYSVYAQRYTWSGTPLGSNFQVNDDTGEVWKAHPAIDMNDSGSFVLTWEDCRGGMYAQRYDSSANPLGPNFKVYNDADTFIGDNPDIAMDESGDFVIAWEDWRSGNRDIYAQRYYSTGTPLGANFKVSDGTETAYCEYPVIAVDSSGDFVVAWEDNRSSTDIYAQRCDFSGAPSGSNFKVNDDAASSDQRYPDVVSDGSGNFAITWQDHSSGHSDIHVQKYSSTGTPLGSNFRVNDDSVCTWGVKPATGIDSSRNFSITWESGQVYAQRYDSTDMPLGPNFKVSDLSYGSGCTHYSPAVATDGSGNFVITWGVECWDKSSGFRRIYAQRYDASGTPVGSNFWVDKNALTDWLAFPAIAMDHSGNFIITWHDWHPDIYAQRYDSSGTQLGSNFRVNDDSGTEDQMRPDVVMHAFGNFVITWYDWRDGNPDIYAQRYDLSCTPLGSNFKVNDDSGTASQIYPAIAMDGSGKFVIIWEDYRDGSSKPGIYAQRYDSEGYPVGPNYLVVNPQYASFFQRYPSVAVNNSNIYFAWMDNRRAKGWDIYAKVVGWDWTEVREDEEVTLPYSFQLSHNYPNPFNPVTRIQYTVGSRQTPIHTTLRVYNILGQLVRTLLDEEIMPGHYQADWDGRDSSGKEVASGIYFYQLKTEDFTNTKKMVLLR